VGGTVKWGKSNTETSELKKPSIILLTLLSVIALIYVFIKNDNRPRLTNQDDVQDLNGYVINSNGYYLTMKTEQKEQIVRNIGKVKKGLTIDAIVKYFGKPTFINTNYSKEGVFHGWAYKYYLLELEKNIVHYRDDKVLTFHFDGNGKLENIATNVKQLKMKEWDNGFYIRGLDER